MLGVAAMHLAHACSCTGPARTRLVGAVVFQVPTQSFGLDDVARATAAVYGQSS